jgi:UDP-N-acetylmuramate--alanine ligase
MIPITATGNTNSIHFIGIGGIGMSGLAEYYLLNGYKVSGSDISASHITERLQKLGAEIHIGHSKDNISPAVDAVVYSSAVQKDNPEMLRAAKLHIKTVKRAEILGEIVNDKFLIAVSGTHGKTTTTAMISKVLVDAGLDPIVFVGGNVNEFGGASSRFGKGKYAVVEADEYDRSFLTLKPDIAVITSIDEDHLDVYKNLNDIKNTFKKFCSRSKRGAKLVYFGDDKNASNTVSGLSKVKISYGFNNRNFLRITGYKLAHAVQHFTLLNSHNAYKNISINLIGVHNVLNSAACFAVSNILGIDFNKYKKSIKEFTPVDRRLQLRYKNGIRVYDDYAHHPREIEVSLKGLKETEREKRIITVFQPHLYSRTKDFYKKFAQSLSIADEVMLLDIYPAREKPIEGVTSELIFNELIHLDSNVKYFRNKNKAAEYLAKEARTNDIIVFQGAGDITLMCDDFVKHLPKKLK